MKIVVDENISYGKEAFENFGEVELIPGREISNHHLINTDALVVRSITKVDENLLKNTKVNFVGTATIGTDHIDKKYLLQKNIEFGYAPGCNSHAVTEYVYSAITYLVEKHNLDFDQMSIGIIGYGNIGTKLEKVAKALGLKTIINDPPLERTGMNKIFSSLNEALKCDIVTFHVPLNLEGIDKTVHLLNEKNISLIKENAILINASRGPVVDNTILKEQLKNGKNIFAVLDVWENEPDYDQELLRLVEIGTPHIAGYSFEGKVNGTTMLYDQLCDSLNIKPTWKPTMPEVLDNIIYLSGNENKLKILTALFNKSYQIKNDDALMRKVMNYPAASRWSINRNICFRPKWRGIKPLSAFGGLSFSKKEKIIHFDSLRKNYRLRRELLNYTTKIEYLNSHNENILSSLRLSILGK